jgi:hypothetical protein
VGMAVTSGQFPANTVVTQIQDNGSYYFVRFSNRHTGISAGQAVTFSYGGDLSGTNYLFFAPASWEAAGAVSGTEVDTSVSTEFPPGTTVQQVYAKTVFGSTEYYRVEFNQTFSGTFRRQVRLHSNLVIHHMHNQVKQYSHSLPNQVKEQHWL